MGVNGKGRLRGKISTPPMIHGKSAYEIAVINGFDGTESDWLKSLHGKNVTNEQVFDALGAYMQQNYITEGKTSVRLIPTVTAYYLSAGASVEIYSDDMASFPDGYHATIVYYNPNNEESNEEFCKQPISTSVLNDFSDDGMPLSELTIGHGNNGVLIHVYKTEGAYKFNWCLSACSKDAPEQNRITEGKTSVRLIPTVTAYYLSASASAEIYSDDMASFPKGYRATIIFYNPNNKESDKALWSYPITTPVLNDYSDEGMPLSELTIGHGNNGVLIHVYKTEGAYKFNWCLSSVVGRGGSDIYVGKEEPTDDNVKAWINPNGTTPNFTNQIPIAKGADGGIYNGTGYKNDTRLNSSKAEATLAGASLSGYIPIENGNIVRLTEGLVKTDSSNPSNGSCNVVLYDSSFTALSAETVFQFGEGTTGLGFENIVVDSDKYLTQFTISSANAAYLRITFTTNITDTDTQFVTVNEEITYGDESVDILTYWLEELETKADAIQQAMEGAGRNKSSFLWYTDAHLDAGNSKSSPLLLNYLYKNTSMGKVFFGGDIIGDPTALTHDTVKHLYDEWRSNLKELEHHSVIGNHDNIHKGRNDSDIANIVYSFLLAPEETKHMVMGDDFYYYIDEPCEKTRYLFLDSGRYSLSDAETEFIIEALKNTPNGWHIVVISHIWFQYTSASEPSVGSMNVYMQKALDLFDAYNNRQSGSITMASTAKSYDFTSCGGKVEFCIGGHIHIDLDLSSTGGIPVVLTASDVNQERSGNETEDSGIIGTITESAVFGIIADYNNSKIIVVGVGRGTSREINY